MFELMLLLSKHFEDKQKCDENLKCVTFLITANQGLGRSGVPNLLSSCLPKTRDFAL